MDDTTAAPPAFPVPPRQQPYDQALRLGFDALAARPPSAAKLAALGAQQQGGAIRLPALNRHLLVGLDARTVRVEEGGPARVAWAILALHYLEAEDTRLDTREVSLGHFADCRGYLAVFGKRIVGRFLATAGRSAERFAGLAERLGGTRLPGSGLGYRFQVLPRVPVSIILYEGDEELGPGASVLYQADAQRLLPAEDRVVVAELVLDTLSGKPIGEEPKEQP